MATKKSAATTKSAAKKTSPAKKSVVAKKTVGTKKSVAVKKTAAKKSPAKKTAAKAAPAAAKKSSTRKSPAKKSAGSMPKDGKDPKGGLTAKGREFYNKQTGGNLRPGVKGAADTPEKKKRKGSFLTRHFTTPPGPVVKDGKPTRQALQAAAWGEPVPKSEADEKKLAAKGRQLLAEAKAAK